MFSLSEVCPSPTHAVYSCTALGVGPKVGNDAFNDLLGGHQFTSKATKPTTLKDMKTEQIAQDMDPDKLKVSIDYNDPLCNILLYHTVVLMCCQMIIHIDEHIVLDTFLDFVEITFLFCSKRLANYLLRYYIK